VNRRRFVSISALGALGLTLSDLDIESFAQAGGNVGPSDLLDLKNPYNSRLAVSVYGPSSAVEKGPSVIPNAILYYDETKQQFVSPLGLEPTLEKGSYSMTGTLRSFNIGSGSYEQASASKSEVQIGLNFTAPLTSSGDKFAWIAKNAVDVFLQKGADVGKYLSSFKTSNPTSDNQKPTNKVQVLQGTFDLQVNAFFQKKDGFWSKLIKTLAKVSGSPLLATLGIPGIALEALDFVSYSFSKLTQDEQLQPLWNARPLTFALTKDAKNKRFGFRPGLWGVIDSSFAQSTNYLENHTVDLRGESFQILDASKKPINANYIMADFDAQS
jgi:hypothetical protein